jgi:hypothetical protein
MVVHNKWTHIAMLLSGVILIVAADLNKPRRLSGIGLLRLYGLRLSADGYNVWRDGVGDAVSVREQIMVVLF